MTDRWTRFFDCRRSRWALWLVALTTAVAVESGATVAVAQAGPPSVVTQAPHAALTPAAFAGLLMRLQRKSFGDEQLGFVRSSVTRGDYFTCAQAGQLMHT